MSDTQSDINMTGPTKTPSPRSSQDQGSKKTGNKKVILCKKIMKMIFSHIGLTAMMLAYAVIGGFVFQILESGNEIQNCKDLSDKYDEVENKTAWDIWQAAVGYAESDLNDPETQENLESVLQRMVVSYREDIMEIGYDGTNCTMLGMDDSVPQDWSFSGSMLFAVTIMTTIGYGNIAPQTMWGRVIVIPYALLGIPIMLLCLANIGDVMADMFKFIYVKVCCCGCFRKKRKPSDTDSQAGSENNEDGYDSDEEDNDQDYQDVSIPLTITLGVIAFYLLFGACVFALWENWDIMEAAYYSFITISTVGFGDYVPGTEVDTAYQQVQMVFASVYMLLGLALLSMCFSLIQEEIAVKFRMLAERIGFNKNQDEEEEDEEGRSRSSSVALPDKKKDKNLHND